VIKEGPDDHRDALISAAEVEYFDKAFSAYFSHFEK
jgi:hypothetical protein